MRKLRPKKAQVWLEYHCPNCESKHLFSLKEIQQVGRFLCYCDETFLLDHIARIDVTPIYNKNTPLSRPISKTETSQESAPETHTDNLMVEDAVSALVNMGSKKREAQAVISKLVSQRSFSNVEELIIEACRIC